MAEDNLIDQIRAVLDAYYDPEANIGTEVNVVARITRILDSAPPAQTTGLPRLAELAEQAGKIRTAEWLHTCAAIPPDEWPPAPTYKGAVVHLDDPRPDFAAMTKAQLRDLCLRIVSELRQRRALSELTGEANRG